jgi:energy-coupling factor transporter transmembrane protein EcfT
MKKSFAILKIILLLMINFFVFVIKNPFVLSALFLIIAIILIPTKYSLLKRLKVILPICLIILLSQIIFNSAFTMQQRFVFGYIASMRIIIVSLSVFVFLATTSLSEIVSVFNFLPKNWLLLLTITCYLIPATLIEAEHIRIVQKSRTVYKNRWNVVQNIASLFVPLLHRIFKRAEVISLTIVSRSFD